jgi:hypothetical protein
MENKGFRTKAELLPGVAPADSEKELSDSYLSIYQISTRRISPPDTHTNEKM